MTSQGWLSLEAAIEYMGGDIHPQTVRRWVREGRLKAVRPTPRCLRFRTDWLDAFMESGTGKSAVDPARPAVAGRHGRIVSINDRRR